MAGFGAPLVAIAVSVIAGAVVLDYTLEKQEKEKAAAAARAPTPPAVTAPAEPAPPVAATEGLPKANPADAGTTTPG